MAKSPSPGPGVDVEGNPVIDPTANVRELVDAAIQRQDDLREAESRHVREHCAVMHSEHARELRYKETERINAIRAVDVEAVQRAAEVQAAQAQTLAATVTTSAEALRVQVESAAVAARVALAAALEPIIKDIADLRRAQYEAQGKSINVVETQAKGASTGLWVGVAIAAVVGVIGLLALAVAFYIALNSPG